MSSPSRIEHYRQPGGSFHPAAPGKVGSKLPESLEDAIADVVYESDLPAKAIASAIGVRYGYLVEAANPNREDTSFQTRWVAPITKASGNDALIRFLAHACGGVFVRLHTGAAFNERTSEILKETADVLQAAAAAEADGIVTAQEAADVRRQVTEAQAALEGFARWTEMRVAVGGDR